MSKPITLHAHATGPNPWKVSMVLEELGVPYEYSFHDFAELKQPAFEKVNPNGRVPAIVDPNTGITLWESGAIIEYLIETYDKKNKLSFGDKSPEKFYEKQFLYFQMSGQGPYFGQKAWFSKFHSETVQSAIDRYANEVKRVVGVLDRALKDNGTGWLVGDKCTYADVAFVSWNSIIPFLWPEEGQNVVDAHPNFKKWHEALMARPAIAKVLQDRAESMAKAGL
ncbi:MAG: glutathione S- transferase, nitrogen catabolite repression regulator [Alyxoria varia]|nr:MAG: glutathione S- transferase, nitrogen catabolite repression regulator [Alyxoria varia]